MKNNKLEIAGYVVLYFILFSPLIAIIILNCINVGTDELEISYWTAITSKTLHLIVSKANPELWLPEYHMWIKPLCYSITLICLISAVKVAISQIQFSKDKELARIRREVL